MSTKQTITATHYLPALRCLAQGPLVVAELAEISGRTKSNIRRDMPKLAQAGLVEIEGDNLSLTDTGRQWVHGQDIAEGLVPLPTSSSATPTRWPLDAIRPNPINRKVTAEGIEDLAASIVEIGDILQPLILTPPAANGVRTILAGERRWTAVRSLVEASTLPIALVEGLPFIEREADDAHALIITLIENSQRRDLSPWEDAQQLLKLADETGWSASEIARRIGRVSADGKGGIRDVQTKLKVAREASIDAVVEYENNGSWDRLRDSVTKPKGPETAHLKLLLVEAALRADDEAGLWDATLTIQEGLEWPQAWAKWFTYEIATGHFTLTAATMAWLEGEGMSDGDYAAVMMRHRAACGLPNRTAARPYATALLNPPEESRSTTPDVPSDQTDAALPLEPAGAAAPASEYAPVVSEMAITAWRELLHKIAHQPTASDATHVGQYWLCPQATALERDGFVRFSQHAGEPPRATLTEAGSLSRANLVALWSSTLDAMPWAEAVNSTRKDWESFDGTNYDTLWLAKIPVAALYDGPSEPAPEPAQGDFEEAAPLRFHLEAGANGVPHIRAIGIDRPVMLVDSLLLLSPARRMAIARVTVEALNANEIA